MSGKGPGIDIQKSVAKHDDKLDPDQIARRAARNIIDEREIEKSVPREDQYKWMDDA